MKNLKIIDQIKDLIFLTGGTLSEILNVSSDDIESAESGETIIDIESAPHRCLFLFFTTDYFDSS